MPDVVRGVRFSVWGITEKEKTLKQNPEMEIRRAVGSSIASKMGTQK